MNRRHIIGGSLLGSIVSLALCAKSAYAADPWIARPLTLPPLHLSADVGLGFAQYRDGVNSDGTYNHSLGSGSNLEAAVGLPILGEVGVRTGARFGDGGKASGADAFGRLFDKQTVGQGPDTFANPEVFLRGTLLDLEMVAIGLDTRFVLPLASDTSTTVPGPTPGTTQKLEVNDSYFSWVPGVPVRVRIPNLARIDTGIYIPFQFAEKTIYAVDIPAHLWFQSGDIFFGPLVGVRFSHNPLVVGDEDKGDIRLGFGGGYTVAGFVDLKAQLYANSINHEPDKGGSWTNTIGFGLGAGINIP
ncbi:hypothetical protein [Pendulispora albinea]|uniref:Outer membrane protein beta-barrel domain-containing protein n=1 Tax=Pendulispora albinea TaxID=2741071 RepID=A0ABZ2M8K2_9BACT